MKLMMLDIETLGTGARAPVFQVAAVTFNPDLTLMPVEGEGVDVIPTGNGLFERATPLEFNHWLSSTDAGLDILRGAEVELGTVGWWQDRLRDKPIPYLGNHLAPRELLRELASFWEQEEPDAIMANSPSFDCIIIQEMARRWGETMPWSFRDWWDLRTLRKVHGIVFHREVKRRETTHDALQDCRDQCWEAAKLLTDLKIIGGSFE